jgi:hypothetical protein
MVDGESHQSIVLRDGSADSHGEGIDVVTQFVKETLTLLSCSLKPQRQGAVHGETAAPATHTLVEPIIL